MRALRVSISSLYPRVGPLVSSLASSLASALLCSLLVLSCDGKSDDDESGGNPPSDGQCEPGSQFPAADGCNTCECPSSGLKADAGCTEIGCVESSGTGATGTGSDGESSAGSVSSDGSDASTEATESGSDSSGDDPDSCVPGDSFDSDDGCNVCQCPASGSKSEASCTELGCQECFAVGACGDSQACNFGLDNCGIFGIVGACIDKPQVCDDGGVPSCTCDGEVVLNGCEALAGDTDLMRYGGCELVPGSFRCGDIDCKLATEYCSIQFNDVAGDDGPEYFAACVPMPAECTEPSCACLEVSPFGSCHQAGAQLMVFEPGG